MQESRQARPIHFYLSDILFEKELLFGGSGGIKAVRIKW
jgi:hypothetical protein